jgi:hypothetical protein
VETRKKTILRGLAVLFAIVAVTTFTRAEEVKGKFRFSFQVTHYSVEDDIRSNANNTATTREGGTTRSLTDPRDDDATNEAASIEDDFAWGANVQYGIVGWKWGELLLEANYNYFESTVEPLEISGAFIVEDPLNFPGGRVFFPDCSKAGKSCFALFPTKIGEIDWHHPQLGALLRFRPAKAFNPYVGAGFGYYLADFSRDSELDLFSDNLEASRGFITDYDFDTGSIKTNETAKRFEGIVVEVDDDFEYHLVAGAEMTFKKKWTIYLDSRFHWTDGRVRITTDGREEFGQPVPDGPVDFLPTSVIGVLIPRDDSLGDYGGLLDVGGLKDDPESVVPCPQVCLLDKPDGLLDPGVVYVQGGEIKYGGFTFSFGLRYTF